MKGIKVYFLFAICSFLFLGCAKQKEDSLKSENLQILVDETGTKEIVIPNPQSLEENKKIVLPYLESLGDKEDLPMVDLTFCGLQNVKINGFEVGNITPAQTSFIHVQHNFSVDFQDKVKMSEAVEKRVLANCLVLFVSVEMESNKSDNYVVVLDYANGKSYKIKTVVEIYGDWLPKIYISDITGDGLDDIIVSNYRNLRNTGMVCEVFRFNSNTLKSIYKSEEKNAEDDTITRRSYFSGQLEDNYKAVIESSMVGFKKSISLLDIGYKSKDLEIYSSRIYKNKKILNTVNRTLYVSPLDDETGVQIIKKSNIKSAIRLMYRIYMPNRIDYIGKAYAYMNYNSTTDSLEITSAFVDFAEPEKDR